MIMRMVLQWFVMLMEICISEKLKIGKKMEKDFLELIVKL